MKLKSLSLGTKFSLGIALVVVVSLGAMSFLAFTIGRESLREQSLSANLTAATLTARALEQYIDTAAGIMREAAERPKLSAEIRKANWPEATKVLKNIYHYFSRFDYLFIQDAQGTIRARVPYANTVGQDFSFREFFQEAVRTRRLFVSSVYISRAARRPVVSIAVPVLDEGEVRGVLVGALSLQAMSQFVSRIGEKDWNHIYVVDGKGLLIAHSGGLNAGSQNMASLPIAKAVMEGKSGTMEFREPTSGEHLSGTYLAIPRLGWGVVVGRPLMVAYASMERLGRWLLWLALGCMGGAILLGFGLARNLTGPLLRLIAATKKVADGEFSVRVETKSRDELALLAASFNGMAESLEHYYTALEGEIHEREQAEAALQDRYRELQTIHELNQAILRSPDLDTVLEKILDQALAVGSFDIGVIRLFESRDGCLLPAVHRGFRDAKRLRKHCRTAEIFSGRALRKMMERRESLVVENVAEWKGLRTFKEEGVQSFVGVSVHAEKELLGVIQVGSRTPRKFQPYEVGLLEAIGSQMGLAFQKARLLEETQHRLRQIQALRGIDLAITATLDLHSILKILLEKIDLALPYAATTVRLFNKESGLLEPVACHNLDEKEWKEEQWKGGRGTPNVVFETKSPLMVRNVQNDPRVQDQGFFRKHNLVSYLGVPLVVKEEILGVLSFYTKEEHEFSSDEIGFLSTLAGQAALALHNSQLYDEIRTMADDLATANRVKDEFLSVMSHELRTPLNVVMGYAGMIQEGIYGKINKEQGDVLGNILTQSRNLLTMINSILFATSLDANEVSVDHHEVHLSHFLDLLRSDLEASLAKGFTLRWDYPSDLPVVATDGNKLRQILHNLIHNAVKFTHEGGVTVWARHSPEAKTVEFGVQDTGIGIPGAMLPFIFDKFRQVDSSETRLYGGVGLGLYIVKRFTELLGGKIEVESDIGKGSAFTVTLPCRTMDEVPAERADKEGGGTKI